MLNAQITTVGDEQVVILFHPEHGIQLAQSDHPHFDAIVEGVKNDDESIVELFDIAKAISTRFEHLSERVSVTHGRVFFDGDEIDNSLTEQILRFQDEGVDDWKPLVNFFEKVQTNPKEFSREQLYSFVKANDITIAEDGDIIFYKGVRADNEGLQSIHAGQEPVTVDGVVHKGYIPNPIGAVVEMPRGLVDFNPSSACSVGLHVATFNYAKSWGHNGVVVKVAVNPRDVVSVPYHENDEKVRVSRYRILEAVEAPDTSAVYVSYIPEDEDYEDEYGCPECGGDEEFSCICYEDTDTDQWALNETPDLELDDTPSDPLTRRQGGILGWWNR